MKTIANFLYISLYCIIFIFLSCSNDNHESRNFENKNISYIDLSVANSYQSKTPFINKIKLTTLKLDTTNIISKINKVIYYKNKLFVVDKQYKSIQVLDSIGNFLYNIGRIGEGPGEYLSIDGVEINKGKDLVVLFCSEKQKFLFYTLEGIFSHEKSMQLFAENFKLLPNGEFVIYTDFNPAKDNNNYDITIFNKNNEVVKEFFPFNGNEILGNGDSGNIVENNQGLLYSSALSDTIYEYQEKKISPKYVIKFQNKVVPYEYRRNMETIQKYFMANLAHLAFLREKFWELGSSHLLIPYLDGKVTFAIYDSETKVIYKENDLVSLNPIFEIISSFSPFIGLKDDKTVISLIDNRKVMQKKNDTVFMERLKQTPYYEQIRQMEDDNEIVLAFITFK